MPFFHFPRDIVRETDLFPSEIIDYAVNGAAEREVLNDMDGQKILATDSF
jgi:hypothetical protein